MSTRARCSASALGRGTRLASSGKVVGEGNTRDNRQAMAGQAVEHSEGYQWKECKYERWPGHIPAVKLKHVKVLSTTPYSSDGL